MRRASQSIAYWTNQTYGDKWLGADLEAALRHNIRPTTEFPDWWQELIILASQALEAGTAEASTT